MFCRTNSEELPDKVCARRHLLRASAPETLRDLVKQRRRWHTGLFETMTKHWRMFANLRFGLVSFFSYTYFLIYELLSPAIELFCLLTVALAVAFNFINIPFMLMFFGIYAVFGAVMSLTAFFSRVQTRDLKLSPHDVAKALLLVALRGYRLAFRFGRHAHDCPRGLSQESRPLGQHRTPEDRCREPNPITTIPRIECGDAHCGHVRARDEHERARDKRASGEAMTSRHTFLSSLGVAQLSARGS